MVGLAFLNKRLFTLRLATGDAINCRWIATILARRATRIGASGNGFAFAFAIASSLKVQRRTINIAIGSNLDFAFKVVEVKIVIATFGRRRNGQRL